MTTLIDTRLVAFRRIATRAIRAAQDTDLAWWEPGDDQRAEVTIEDGWGSGASAAGI